MKVLGVGLGRTGTSSLKVALKKLGYKTKQFDSSFLDLLRDDKSPDLSKYDDIDALVDIPTALYYKDFLLRYPNLKCVLTVRNTTDWLSSMKRHYETFRPDERVKRARVLAFGIEGFDKDVFAARYAQWNEQVLRDIQADQLLVLDVDEKHKWEKLCEFLGEPIPSEPWPWENKQSFCRVGSVKEIPRMDFVLNKTSNVSAVIPVYNTHFSELYQAVDSLIATCVVKEIILVDDHSDDKKTQDALRAFSERGIRVIQNFGNKSISRSRAVGVHHATGQYVLNMDSDDLIFNKRFNPSCLAPINFTPSNAHKVHQISLWEYLDQYRAIQWGSIVRSDLARSIAVDVGSRQEDIAWAYRLFMTAWRDKTPANPNTGLYYHWRSADFRSSMTANCAMTKKEFHSLIDDLFKRSMDDVGLCQKDKTFIQWWRNRRELEPRVVQLGNPNARVDVHVLSYLGNLSWLQQTLDSLLKEDVNIYLVMGGFPGHIGKARAFAFTLGSAEYVSFVDDDDYLLPNSLQPCLDVLDESPLVVGVYTDTVYVREGGKRKQVFEKKHPWCPLQQYKTIAEITHLKVMRRSVVEKYLDELENWPTWEEYVLCGLMANDGDWVHLPIQGAIKRSRSIASSSSRLATPELTAKARKRVEGALKSAYNRSLHKKRHKRQAKD